MSNISTTDYTSIAKLFVSILALILSIVAFVFSAFPQRNPFNSNPTEKAYAGDVKSQMFLANHYFEIRDVEESYYWYKIASSTKGKYQAVALNNLAYIELNYMKSEDSQISFTDKAYHALELASTLGNITALKNEYLVLISNPKNSFNEIDYLEIIEEVEKQLIKEKIDITIYEKYKDEWKYKETIYNAHSIPKDTKDMTFKMIGSDYVYSDTNSFQWIYTYEVYQRNTDIPKPNYEYISDF